MHMNRFWAPILAMVLLVSLSACSGDGDTPTPPPATAAATSAEGLWSGATDTTNRTVTGVVLDDGVYWFLYSVAGDPSLIAGLVQGDSSSQNGALTSSNATDFSVERGIPPTLTASVDGNYTGKQSLNGTISFDNNTQPQETFRTTYDSDYESAPDINAVVGRYTGIVIAGETVTVDVFTDKTISGFSNTGCTFSGSFSPRARGNVFDVSITFGPEAACNNKKTETEKGVGFFHAGKLYSGALNSTKADGFVFIGTKQ
jgi:hypothetical protein